MGDSPPTGVTRLADTREASPADALQVTGKALDAATAPTAQAATLPVARLILAADAMSAVPDGDAPATETVFAVCP